MPNQDDKQKPASNKPVESPLMRLIKSEHNTACIYGQMFQESSLDDARIESEIDALYTSIKEIENKIAALEAEKAVKKSEIEQTQSKLEDKKAYSDQTKNYFIEKCRGVIDLTRKYDAENKTAVTENVIRQFEKYGFKREWIEKKQTPPQQPTTANTSESKTIQATPTLAADTFERKPRAKRYTTDNVAGPIWNPASDSTAQNFNYNAVFPSLKQESFTDYDKPSADPNTTRMVLLDTALDHLSDQVNDILTSRKYRLSVDTTKNKNDPNNNSLVMPLWVDHITKVFEVRDGYSIRPFEFHAGVVYDNFKNQFYYRFTRGNDPKGIKKDFQTKKDQLFDEATQLTIFLLVDELCNYYYNDANPIAFNYINRDMKHHFIIKRPYLFYLADMAIEYMKSDYLGTYDNILAELSENIKKWEKEDPSAYKNESPNADVSPFAEIFFSFVLYIANGFSFSMAKEYSFECRAAIQDALLDKYIDFKLYEKVYKAATYIKVSSDNFENEVIMRTLWVFPKKYPYDTSEKLLPKLLEKCRK